MRRWWLSLALCEACLFPSLDDFSASDSGIDAADATFFDVGGDAVGDASNDADAATRFCASHPAAIFCDDFDDAGTVSPSWTVQNLSGDASLSIVQDQPVSLPNVARSTVAATTNSSEANIGRKVSIASGQTLTFGAAVRADDWPAGPYASLTSIYTDQTHAASLVLGYNNKSPLFVVDDADGGSSTYAVALPQSGWFRFAYVLAVSGSTSTIDFLVDGQTAIGGPKSGPPIPSSFVTVYLGIYATNYSSQIAWSFDDTYAEVK